MIMDNVKQKHSVAGLSFFLAGNAVLALNYSDFEAYRQQLLLGGIVNISEQSAATHAHFRHPAHTSAVKISLARIKKISDEIRQHVFFDVQDVVNLGIGGSDLGPKLITEAFSEEMNGPRMHFVSNLDAAQIHALLPTLSPQHTLFIATSKSFKTLETLENMAIATAWLTSHHMEAHKHFVAVTHNVSEASKYGIPDDRILSIPDSVGGRYSIWSAVGLPCAIAFGFEKFYALHQGAYEMDTHFFKESLECNLPVIYASNLYDAIKNNALKTVAILPYAYRLRSLSDYLQQLFMESLGKHVNQQGDAIDYSTGPIVFGSTGTNSQHSFQQLMMQGTHPIFADFILPLTQKNVNAASHSQLIANCLTQVNTLRKGVNHSDPMKQIPAGKQANLILMNSLDLKTLGALLAFYEHVVVTLGFMMNINPFDQWGVEHAKIASKVLQKKLNGCIPTVEEIEGILDLTQ